MQSYHGFASGTRYFFVLAVVSVLPIALFVLISSVSASTDVTRTSYITGLNSPRGLMINADGNLVIAEQGTGADDGRLLEAIDLNDDGDANDKGELKKIANGLPSSAAILRPPTWPA